MQGAPPFSFPFMSSLTEAVEMVRGVSSHGVVYDFTQDVNCSRQALRKRDAPAVMELLQCSSRLLQVDMLC